MSNAVSPLAVALPELPPLAGVRLKPHVAAPVDAGDVGALERRLRGRARRERQCQTEGK